MDNSDINEISLLSWGSGNTKTKDELSQNNYTDDNIKFNDNNLLSETANEYDNAVGNTITRSISDSESDGENNDLLNLNKDIENELRNNVEIITINDEEKKKDDSIFNERNLSTNNSNELLNKLVEENENPMNLLKSINFY